MQIFCFTCHLTAFIFFQQFFVIRVRQLPFRTVAVVFGQIQLWKESNQMAAAYKLDIDDLICKILNVGAPGCSLTKTVKESDIMQLCEITRGVFLSQSSLIEIDPPIRICGDTHGQYAGIFFGFTFKWIYKLISDVMRLFDRGGFPPCVNYLFLGDYVDRGRQNLETICLFFCYKVSFFTNIFSLTISLRFLICDSFSGQVSRKLLFVAWQSRMFGHQPSLRILWGMQSSISISSFVASLPRCLQYHAILWPRRTEDSMHARRSLPPIEIPWTTSSNHSSHWSPESFTSHWLVMISFFIPCYISLISIYPFLRVIPTTGFVAGYPTLGESHTFMVRMSSPKWSSNWISTSSLAPIKSFKMAMNFSAIANSSPSSRPPITAVNSTTPLPWWMSTKILFVHSKFCVPPPKSIVSLPHPAFEWDNLESSKRCINFYRNLTFSFAHHFM